MVPGTSSVTLNHIEELVDVIETHHHHNSIIKLRAFFCHRVVRRLHQVQIERKQRRKQVILETLDEPAYFRRQVLLIQQFKKCLMRVQ